MLDIWNLHTAQIWVDMFLFGIMEFLAIFWILRRLRNRTRSKIPKQARLSPNANNEKTSQQFPNDSSSNGEPFRSKEASNSNNPGNFVTDLKNHVSFSVI